MQAHQRGGSVLHGVNIYRLNPLGRIPRPGRQRAARVGGNPVDVVPPQRRKPRIKARGCELAPMHPNVFRQKLC